MADARHAATGQRSGGHRRSYALLMDKLREALMTKDVNADAAIRFHGLWRRSEEQRKTIVLALKNAAVENAQLQRRIAGLEAELKAAVEDRKRLADALREVGGVFESVMRDDASEIEGTSDGDFSGMW